MGWDGRWTDGCPDIRTQALPALQASIPTKWGAPSMGFLQGKSVSLQGCPASDFRSPGGAPALLPTIPETREQGPSPCWFRGRSEPPEQSQGNKPASLPPLPPTPLTGSSPAPGPPKLPSTLVLSRALGAQGLRFKPQLSPPPVGKPPASYFTPPDLSFLSCKMGIIIIPAWYGCKGHMREFP